MKKNKKLSFMAMLAAGCVCFCSSVFAQKILTNPEADLPSSRDTGGFGNSISFSGDKLAVAEYVNGEIHVYERQSHGLGHYWLRNTLTETDFSNRDGFYEPGTSVALDNDTLLIGVNPNYSADGSTQVAYVFEAYQETIGNNSYTYFKEADRIKPNNSSFDFIDDFGFYTALKGNTAMIGAFDAKDSGYKPIFFFDKQTNGTWAEVGQKTFPYKPYEYQVGFVRGPHCMKLRDPNFAIAGSAASQEEFPSYPGGAVQIFERQGDGSWASTQELKPDTFIENDLFGYACDAAEDSIVVGAPGSQDIYFFEPDPSDNNTWVQVNKVHSDQEGFSSFPNKRFGGRLSLVKDRLAVGHADVDVAYVLEKQNGSWVHAYTIPYPGEEDDPINYEMGTKVALSEDGFLAVMSDTDTPNSPFHVAREEIFIYNLNDVEGSESNSDSLDDVSVDGDGGASAASLKSNWFAFNI